MSSGVLRSSRLRSPGAGSSEFRFFSSAGSKANRFSPHFRSRPPAPARSTRGIPGSPRSSSAISPRSMSRMCSVVLRWLLPSAALAWAVVSGVGRNLLLMRMEPGVEFRPFTMIVLQGAWLALLGLTLWGWFVCMQWAAATHITARRRAGPGRLFHLGDRSCARLLHRVRAHQLGAFNCADSCFAGKALRAFGFRSKPQAGQGVLRQARRDQPGSGNR